MPKILLTFALSLAMLSSAPSETLRPMDTNRADLDRAELALLASDAAVRGFDVYSTHRMLDGGNKEAVLPNWIASRPVLMAAYAGGVVTGERWAISKLNRRHRKMARWIPIVDIAITAPFAVRNVLLPVCRAPDIYTAAGCQAAPPL